MLHYQLLGAHALDDAGDGGVDVAFGQVQRLHDDLASAVVEPEQGVRHRPRIARGEDPPGLALGR